MAWATIPNFPDYVVSDDGRVISHKRRKARVLSAARDQNGYPIVALTESGRLQSRRVHILIVEAFIGPRPPGAVIRHRDGNPANCTLANLEYGTPSDNSHDAVAHGTHVQASKTHCANGHEYTAANTYWRPDRTGRLCRICRAEASRRCDRRRALAGGQ